jgi:N-acetylneuraminate synthase
MATNHLGSVERGLKIISEFSHVVRFNNVHASIKLQFPDVENSATKTRVARLIDHDYRTLVHAIQEIGCIVIANPLDERSVGLCVDLRIPIVEISRAQLNDWSLLETIARTRKPVVLSSGGLSVKDMDDLVAFFEKWNIPLAINHCVSIDLAKDSELEINQIDFLRSRYPDNAIGYSTHEYTNSTSSMMIAYAKGARVFERQIDIDSDGLRGSPSCSLPLQVDEWFKAFQKAKKMCGAPGTHLRMPTKQEIEYLDALLPGVYAKRSLPKGHPLTVDDVYLAIPLQKGQLSPRELTSGDILLKPVKKDQAICIDDVDNQYAQTPSLRKKIYNRTSNVN